MCVTAAVRLGYKRAILATAHKLLRVIHAVLRDDRPYTDPGIDYERLIVARNAPRWIRMLTQRAVSTTLRQPDSAFTVATPRW